MLHSTPYITAYCLTLAVVLGLCMGSFLNCLAWRGRNPSAPGGIRLI